MVAGSKLLINEHGIFITTPKTFQVKSNEKVMMSGEKVSFRLPNILLKPDLSELEKVKLTPNQLTASLGILGCIEKQGGFSECGELFIDNIKIQEFWLSLDNKIYYIPPKNIANSKTITIDGIDYQIENELTIVGSMTDTLDSLSQQFGNLNQLKKDYVTRFGQDNANVILMNGLNRYLIVLEHIHTLKWEQAEFAEFYQKISESQLNFKDSV